MAARFPREERRSRLPSLPRGIFFAVLFVVILLFKGCREFWGLHLLFSVGLVGCGLSTGAWLLIASGLRQDADRRRAANIEQFLADPAQPVPAFEPALQARPGWIRFWNGLNVSLFSLLMGGVAVELFMLTSKQQ